MLDTPQQFLILSKCLIQESKMPKQSPFPRWLKLLIFDGNFLSLSFSRRPGSKKRLSLKRRRGISFRNKKTCSVSSGDFLRGPFGNPIFCVFTCEGRGCWAQGLVDGCYWEKLRWWNLKISQIFFKTPFGGGGHLGFQGCFCNLLLLRMIRSQRLWEFFIHVNWFHGVRNLEGLMTYVHSVDSLLFSVPHLPGVSGYGGTWGNNSPMGTGFSSKETHNSSNV